MLDTNTTVHTGLIAMSENPLVALATALRTALSAPLKTATEDKAGQTARLDIIDMIPDLQRTLMWERDTIRNMTWSVDLQDILT